MRNIFCVVLLLFGVTVFSAGDNILEEVEIEGAKAELSYAFGMLFAEDLVDIGFEFDYYAFILGFRAKMEKQDTIYTMDEAIEIIDTAFSAVQAQRGERNRVEATEFLTENGKRPEVNVTPSGLQYEVISEGTGEVPGPDDMVLVHYRGTTIDGAVFDTTYERGAPVEIPLERVIPGWSEGLRMMREGGQARLYIPSDLAYGEWGAGAIGPNSVIIFDVELLAIVRSQIFADD